MKLNFSSITPLRSQAACRVSASFRFTSSLFVFSVLLYFTSVPSNTASAQGRSNYERLEQAAEMIRQGRLRPAEIELHAVLRQSPREANALNLLGVIRAQQQRQSEAERLFLEALDVAPSLIGAYLNLGQLYASSQKPERSLWAFTEASKLAPDRPDINYNLASLYVEGREYERALEYLGKIPRPLLGLNHLYLLVKSHLGLGRRSEAQALISPLKQPGLIPAETAASFAAVLAEGGLPDQAIEILQAALKQEPKSFAALYNLGASYYQKGELSRAEEFYTAALAVRPNDIATLRALARVARSQNELEKALSFLVRARKLMPDNRAVLYDFAWTALKLNLLYDALQVLEQLHRKQPDEPGYLYALAVAHLLKGDAEKAQPTISRYIELRPQDARGYLILGITLYTIQKLPQARVSLERSVALSPSADAEYYLGLIADSDDDLQKAIEWLGRAIQSEPRHAAARAALGTIYIKQKNFEAAHTELERAIEIDPKHLKAHYQLGIVYSRLGDKTRSQQMFAAAEKLRAEERQQQNTPLRLIDPPQ
jgi:tetratricopeptide (TPR) repeat protein